MCLAEGDTAQVGGDLAHVEPGEDKAASAPAPKAETPKPAAPKKEEVKAAPAPAAKSTPAPAPASTPKAAAPKPAAAQTVKSSDIDPTAIPGASIGTRTEKRVKMNRMRLRIAERLKESQNVAASLTTFNEIDMRYASWRG